jgi:hypothetical protein
VSQFLRSGDWIVNIAHVSAVRYTEGTIEIYITGESHQRKGGFSAVGEEAERLWALWCELSTDIMSDGLTLHRRVKASEGERWRRWW